MVKRVVKAIIIIAIAAAVGSWGYAVCMGMVGSLHPVPPADKGRLRVACVGDSITYGYSLKGQPWNSYPKQLGRLLGEDYQVVNFGFSGRTAMKSGDFPYTNEALYTKSLEFGPEIVLIMLGTNDSKPFNWDAAAYKADMISLIGSYEANEPEPQVMIMLPPPAFEKDGEVGFSIRADVIEDEVLPVCREIAEEKGLRLIDTNSPFIGRPKLFVDGVHPTAEGAGVLAQTVYEAITHNDAGN